MCAYVGEGRPRVGHDGNSAIRLPPPQGADYDHGREDDVMKHIAWIWTLEKCRRKCVQCALSNGHTQAEAATCDEGSVGCPDCPFAYIRAKSRRGTLAERRT